MGSWPGQGSSGLSPDFGERGRFTGHCKAGMYPRCRARARGEKPLRQLGKTAMPVGLGEAQYWVSQVNVAYGSSVSSASSKTRPETPPASETSPLTHW